MIALLVALGSAQDCNLTDFDSREVIDSGKFINDLGDYDDCIRREGYSFITLVVPNVKSSTQYVGSCLPSTCTPTFLNEHYSKAIADQLNKAYQKLFNTTQKVVPYVVFYDAVEDLPKWTPSRVFVAILLLSLLGISVVASALGRMLGKGKLGNLVRCFSLKDNLTKVLSLKEPQNSNLTFLNGVRVLSMTWVITGHCNWIRVMSIRNWVSTMDILQLAGMPTLITSAYFAVDAFFWVGGFLLTIGLLQKLNPRKFVKNYFGLILHRLIRIWPTYITVLLFFWKIYPMLGDGPVFAASASIVKSCDEGGFVRNLLFIDNFGDHGKGGTDYCFGWGWYLAVDFQLFIITPFIFLAYRLNKKAGLGVILTLFAGSILIAWLLIYINQWRYPNWNPKLKPQPTFMDSFYYKPWVRASTYLMGLLSGIFYCEWKENNARVVYIVNRIKQSIRVRIMLYAVGVLLTSGTILVSVPYLSGEANWSNLQQAFYNSLNRVAFILGLILVTLPCMFGCKNDPCHIILGAKIFYPLAKVSFCTYLVHFVFVLLDNYSLRALTYWETYPSLIWTLQDIIYSFFFGAVLSMIIEAPVLNLQKILMGSRPRKDKSREESPPAVREEETALVDFKEQGQGYQPPLLIKNDQL